MGKITPVVKTLIVLVTFLGFTHVILSGSNINPSENSYKEKGRTEMLLVETKTFNPEITITGQNTTCSNNSDGAISVAISDGSTPYTFSWTGPGSFSAATEDISNLSPGTYTITVTDNDGNSASKNHQIVVEDNEDPVARAKNITVALDATGNVNITATDVDNGSTDNCGIAGLSLSKSTFNCSNVGANSLVLTVTDINGNTLTTNANVLIEDKIAPTVITKDITVQLDAAGYATIAEDAVNNGSSDSCGGLTFDTSITNFDCEDIGSNTVELTVTDVNGNSAKKSAIVTVEDKIKPEQPTISDLTWTCDTVITEFPITTDNCDTEITGTTTEALEFEGYGEYTITWRFTDSSNNSVTATQKIIIPEPTVHVPDINGKEFCDAEEISGIAFTGNTLENKSYSWYYKDDRGNTLNIGIASSGTGNIPGFTAKNTTSDPVTAVFTVIPLGNGCEGEPVNFSIIVNPTPNVTVPNNIEVCAGATVSEINLSHLTVDDTSVSWVNDNTNIGLHPSGNGTISAFTAQNSTTEKIVANINLTPTANNCEGEVQTFSITVKPSPILTVPKFPPLCNGIPTANPIDLEGSFSGISFDISGGSSIGLANRANVTAIPVFTPVNNGVTPVTATIKITPIANGCSGEPIEIVLTVKPSPVVDASFTNQICSGEQTDIDLSSPGTNTGFSWTVDVPAGIEGAIAGSLDTEGTIEQELINTTNTPKTIIYRISPVADGCAGTEIPVSIIVNPTPVFIVTNPDPVCSPAQIDLTKEEITEGSTAGTTLTYWTNETASNALQDPQNVGPGTYYIKVTTSNGCTIIKPVDVIQNPTPELTSTLQAPGFCSEFAFEYEFSSDVPETEFNWNRKTTDGISTPGNSGSGNINEVLVNETTNSIEVVYEITLISPEGCSNVQEIKTTVTPTPLLTSTLTPEGICSGLNFEYNPTSATGGTIFSWTREAIEGISNPAATGTGPINETLENTTTQAIGVTYTYTLSSNNCENPQEYKVNVVVTPSPDTQVQISTAGENNKQEEIEICPGGSVDLFSSTSFPNNPTLPSEVLRSNFNDGNPGWSLNPSNTNERWRLTNSGELAYTSCGYVYVGPNYWNYEYQCNDHNFRSNDNTRFFSVNSNDYGGDFNNIMLISPILNTQGYSTLYLKFWHHYRDGGASRNNQRDIGYLQYRYQNNNGTWINWQNIDTYTSTEGNPDNFVQREYNINNLINRDAVQIRFRYHNANSDWYWAIDNVSIIGDGTSNPPEVEWTADTSDWTSNEENPTNITPSQTTIYTATYTDPETGCPGSASVTVTVRDAPNPTINANYCAYPEEPNTIELSADQDYDRYEWTASGEFIDDTKSIKISTAQGYTLRVWKNGCEGTVSTDISENLVENGNFELGNEGFNTNYGYKTDDPNRRDELFLEGLYTVDDNSNAYHSHFNDQGDHTSGEGNFMIINGDPNKGTMVWETEGYLNVKPNTDYYFSAWTTNLVSRTEANKYALLRLQVFLPNNNNPVAESTLGDLRFKDVGEWIEFYNPELWNSGSNTQVKLRIINENPIRDGNDFGIDDISFAELSAVEFEFTPENNGPICENENIVLSANLDGARLPIKYEWRGPNGFSRTKTITSEDERTAADTIQIPNATALMAGEYSLKISDFYGCNLETKTTILEIIEKAVVFAGDDMEVCSAEATISLSQATITHPGLATGFWSTIDGDNSRFDNPDNINTTYHPNETEINSGEIQLVLTATQDANAVCDPVSDTISILFNVSPQIELVPQNVSCFEGSDGEIAINILENTGTAPFTYEWFKIENEQSNPLGQTGERATGLNTGTYSVTITDTNGCTATAETIINQPQELIVGTPVQLEEASCFDENSSVVAIPVSGGLFEGEALDPENIPYSLEILNSTGDVVTLDKGNIQYNPTTNQFIISGLQGGAGYTFLLNISENCNVVVKTFTTITPPEINPGEAPVNLDCGVKTILLAATPVNPETGTGSWSYNNGETNLFSDPTLASTTFTGEPGVTYTLVWTVSAASNESCSVSKEFTVNFPPACRQLNFDGEDDFVDLGNHYNRAGSNISIEAWVKPNSLTGTRTIFSKREENNLNSGYDLILNNGSPTFRVGNRSVVSANRLTTDRWFHIAAVYTGQQLQLYVDGIQIQTNNNTAAIINNNAPAIIGATHASSLTGSTNNFSGFIEELRVWNKAIPVEQIRFFMNQRLVKDGLNVSGEVLGNNLNLPNAPQDVLWENLSGYYQLLAEEDLIVNGFTDNLGSTGTAAHGLMKNIELMQENTAPLPYILYTSGNEWFNKATWRLPAQLNGKNVNARDVWNAPGSRGIDNRNTINWNIVKLAENIENPGTVNNQNSISLLGLISESGIFNMNGVKDMSPTQNGTGTGNGLTITHYLQLDGVIYLNGESQLIQTEGSVLNDASLGYIEKEQQGTMNSFNYNYWSSPVSIQKTPNNSGFKIASILKDGTNTDNLKNISFGTAHTFADNPYTGNLRISSYWLNIFHGTADDYGQWHHITQDVLLPAGTGYTMKGTSGAVPINQYQNYIFRGKPNNGTITLAISDQENRLVGNPYPSAIDMVKFIRDNLKDIPEGKNTKNVFNGAIYFWDHFGKEDTHILAEYVGGYATYNLSGGTPGVSNDRRINSNGNGGSKRPGRWIPVGQGFFVNTAIDDAVAGNYSIQGGNITFKNSQRIYVRENPGNSSFLRPEIVTKDKQAVFTEDDRFKIRLDFKSPTGYNRQILVTSDPVTTNEFDLAYDAPLIDDIPEDMFWLINSSPFVIQAVSNFNVDQVLPLAIKISTEGEFSIEIAELENIPDDVNIYLKDKETQTYRDLRENKFLGNTNIGYFPERYEIVFQKQEEVEEEPEDPEPGEIDEEQGKEDKDDIVEEEILGQPTVAYLDNNQKLLVKNPKLYKINKIILHGLTGQIIEEYNNVETKLQIFLPVRSFSSAVYVVKMFTDRGIIQKKIIINN